MYRSNKFSKRPPPATPKPVFVSQRRNEPEKENELEIQSSEDVLPSSQNEAAVSVLTQSRFLSQRHQISRATQEQVRGKNYFEISLISCKINVTELGKESNFINNSANNKIEFL